VPVPEDLVKVTRELNDVLLTSAQDADAAFKYIVNHPFGGPLIVKRMAL
jgi:hypothetical protein